MSAKMPGGATEAIYGRTVDRLVEAAIADPRLKALWLEGRAPAEVRRPYPRLEAHLAADEPDFDSVLGDLEALVAGPSRFEVTGRAEVPRFAREIRGLLDGVPVTVVLEKTSLLPKRPRAEVAMLVDKTGHAYTFLDFSGRER